WPLAAMLAVAMVCGIVGVAASVSRSGWLALAVAVGVLVAGWAGTAERRGALVLAGVAAAGLVVLAALVALLPGEGGASLGASLVRRWRQLGDVSNRQH